MSADPFRIFREASSVRQENLKIVWPELYDCLARAGSATQAARQVKCAMCAHRYPNEPAPAVGRTRRNGQPACASCLAELADRPGGWPLRLLGPGESA